MNKPIAATHEPGEPATADAAMLALYAVDPEDPHAARLALQAVIHAVSLELARRACICREEK